MVSREKFMIDYPSGWRTTQRVVLDGFLSDLYVMQVYNLVLRKEEFLAL